MEGQILPSEWSFYTPLWLNFINNAALVQWCHRILALTILGYVIIQWQRHGVAYRLLAISLIMQVCLGVVTLLWQTPLILALLHQTWAMIVWLIALKTVLIPSQQYGLLNWQMQRHTRAFVDF